MFTSKIIFQHSLFFFCTVACGTPVKQSLQQDLIQKTISGLRGTLRRTIGGGAPQPPISLTQESVKIDRASLDCASLDCLVEAAIGQKIFPGAVVLIAQSGRVVYHKAFGRQTYEPTSTPITLDTLFDLASLTKPIATTTAAMLLYDRGLLDLEAPVCHYLPEFGANGKDTICIKHLLTHTSGLDAGATPPNPQLSRESFLVQLMHQPPVYPCELLMVYSDIGFIILQQVIEKITQQPLDEFCEEQIFRPLGMTNTHFNPLTHLGQKEYAPTTTLQSPLGKAAGVVNDPKAFLMGGVAGHAGLFSTAADLEHFMNMILHYGYYRAHGREYQLIKEETIRSWTQQQCPFNRGYGWELGRHLSSKAFGHFGWVGTSMWADRDKDILCIMLTNRAYGEDHARTLPLMTKFRIAFHETIMHTLVNQTIRKESSVCHK